MSMKHLPERLLVDDNPYRSPEVAEDAGQRPATLAMTDMWRGLDWMMWATLGWMMLIVLAWMSLLLDILDVIPDGGVADSVGMVWGGFFLTCLLSGVLCPIPGLWLCWRGMANSEDRGARQAIATCVSCIFFEFPLLIFPFTVPISAVLCLVSIWMWLRFLGFVCGKFGLENTVVKTAWIMVNLAVAWFVLGALILVGYVMEIISGIPEIVLLAVMCVLPGVYFALELWVLYRLQKAVRG